MINKISILSTKKLTPAQKELFLGTGLGLVEYDAIKIDFLKLSLQNILIENAIFTSQNAVKAVLEQKPNIDSCFCVGQKTQTLLKKNNYHIAAIADNAKQLADIIVTEYTKQSFVFFCGNRRRDELPTILKNNKITVQEKTVYQTSSHIVQFYKEFDGIMFFSPSAVQSFTQNNTIGNSIVFCIGNTTATEAQKHTQNLIVANKPSIENVLVQVARYFAKNTTKQTGINYKNKQD